MASFGPAPPKGPRKLAYSHTVEKAPQKCHFESYNGSDHDAMQKRRLASRVFGFTRHHKPYTNLSITQPPRDCDAYAPDEERLNTDVDGHLRELRRQSRAKEAAIVDRLGAEREYQKQKVRNKTEEDWQKDEEHVKFLKEKPHARVQSNKSGSEYDIFTLEYSKSFGGQLLKYADECQKWRASVRKMQLRDKSSGCANYNIISWEKRELVKPMTKPTPPGPYVEPPPPPARTRARSLGPVLNKEEIPPVCTEAGLDKLEFCELSEPEPEVKLRDILVRTHHPWEVTS